MLKKICTQSHGNLLRTTCSMRFPHPIFTHPILQLLEKCKTLHTLNQVHAQMIATGLALHTYPVSRLLFFSSTLAFSYALSIFNQTVNPTIFLYNTIISSFCNKKQYIHIALSLYNRILTHTTFKPNSHTFPSLFKACGSHPWLHHGRALHAHVLKFLEPSYDHFVQASLLNYYANYGKLDVARYLFNEITQPDLASWNSILAAYARISCVNSEDDIANFSLEAFHLFREMQNSEVSPNEVTLVALISACANLAAFSQGAWAHVYVIRNNLRLNRYVGTALIEMYSKCGYLELAHQLFDKLPSKDTLCYNSMIGGLAIHGHGNRALRLYDKMKLEGIPPDDVTFIVTMFACSHVGLVEEGCKIFESIEVVYKFEPKVEHYGCLIDLLGRAGRVKEAEEMVRKMPMKPNAVLWRSLLGAARIHGHLEVGEIALKHLSELEPETSGNYVLLSNMYASTGGWDDVKRLRKFMKDQRVNKMPGTSVLDIGGATHEFLADTPNVT